MSQETCPHILENGALTQNSCGDSAFDEVVFRVRLPKTASRCIVGNISDDNSRPTGLKTPSHRAA